MARGGDRDRDRDRKRSSKDLGRRAKKRVCIFCKDHIDWVDYKDVNLLRRFISDRGKIRARRVSGNCSQHQREVAVAIKTARELALLPYATRTLTERTGPRGPRQDRSEMAPLPTPDAADVVGVDDVVGTDEMDDSVVGGSPITGDVDEIADEGTIEADAGEPIGTDERETEPLA
jgi:small subunit ribosomal protein S18